MTARRVMGWTFGVALAPRRRSRDNRGRVRSAQGIPFALSVRPDPRPEEQEAIGRALAEPAASAALGRGAWWDAGVRENVDAPQERALRAPR